MTDQDISYMHRALELAQRGAGRVSPNPMVGAVLVYDNKIIGEGYHEKVGFAHAEVNCFNSVDTSNKEFISQATLYVSLEPCSHFGRTPPCVDRILHEGVQKVVVAMKDPFEQVSGKGIQKLKEAGVHVEEHVLEREAAFLNRRFIKFYTQKLPYVILKWAQTNDGFIASGSSRLHITSDESNKLVHTWRSEEDAILIGAQTAIQDDPQLTVRWVAGESPKRFIWADAAKLPSHLKMFHDGRDAFVFNKEREDQSLLEDNSSGRVHYLKYDAARDLESILEKMYSMGIQSVFVEGGAKTLNRFIQSELFDEIRVLTNTKLEVGKGVPAPQVPVGLLCISQSYLGSDSISQFIKA